VRWTWSARDLNVKPEEVREMETRLSGGDVVLDPSPSDDGEDSYGPIAYLADATPRTHGGARIDPARP
jgi:RNA polymerase sigma-32 factor